MTEIILPNDRIAELAALGSMMIDSDAAAIGVERLTENDFFDPRISRVFGIIRDLFNEDSPTDFSSVLSALARHGEIRCGDIVSEAHQTTVTSANIDYHIKMLKACSSLRNIYREGLSISQDALRSGVKIDSVLQRIESLYSSVIDEYDSTGFRHISTGLDGMMQTVESIVNGETLPEGVSTGLIHLDRFVNLRPGELSILAAGASVGKSAMAIDNVAMYVAKSMGIPVGVFSLEMSFAQVQMRIVCSENNLDVHDFQNGRVSKECLKSVGAHLSSLAKLPIYVDDTGYINLAVLKSRARRLKKRFPELGLLIVDYLQLVDQPEKRGQSREQEVSKITRTLKGLSKELDLHIMALSQLSRNHESRTPPYPQLRDLRESGAIEQDADIVLFIYRKRDIKEDPVTGKPEMLFHDDGVVIVGKNRNGKTGGIFDVWFDSKSCKFHAESKRDDAPPAYGEENQSACTDYNSIAAGVDNLPF